MLFKFTVIVFSVSIFTFSVVSLRTFTVPCFSIESNAFCILVYNTLLVSAIAFPVVNEEVLVLTFPLTSDIVIFT